MSLRKLVALSAFAALVPLHATAQSLPVSPLGNARVESRSTPASAQPAGRVSLNRLNLTGSAAEATALQPARQPLPMRGFFGKLHVGAWTSAGSGLAIGGGVGMLPFDSNQHEITGNASFLRVEGTNGFMIDANYFYNFRLDDGPAVTPYAGAGLNVARFSYDVCGDLEDEFEDIGIDCDAGNTEAALQVGGGIKKPLASGREVFGEILFVLSDGGPIVIRGGVNF